MKKHLGLCILVSFSSLFLAFESKAQDMKKKKGSNISNKRIPTALKRVLRADKTDEHPYIAGKFYCNNFASQFFLQNSNLINTIDAYNIEVMAREWGTIISRLSENEKLPIYYVSLHNEEHGFHHAMNAYLLDPKKPEASESYLFIEPQSDEVLFSLREVYDHYRPFFDKSDAEEVMKISIGTFDSFTPHPYSGLYQSSTNNLYGFEVKFK